MVVKGSTRRVGRSPKSPLTKEEHNKTWRARRHQGTSHRGKGRGSSRGTATGTCLCSTNANYQLQGGRSTGDEVEGNRHPLYKYLSKYVVIGITQKQLEATALEAKSLASKHNQGSTTGASRPP